MPKSPKIPSHRGRKKDAPPKADRPETLTDAITRCIYGRFYNDELQQWISAASLMTHEKESEVRNAAARERDPDRKRSLLGAADLVRDSRSDLEHRVTEILVSALLDGKAQVFADVAAIIGKCYRRTGAATFDPVRYKLLSKYERLCLMLRRPPTRDELREIEQPPVAPDTSFQKMAQPQFSRMIGPRDLNLTLTPKALVTALNKIPRTSPGIVKLGLVKEVLRRSKSAEAAFHGEDHESLCFAETMGLEFDPLTAVRANHRCLQTRYLRPPSIRELGLHLRDYVVRRLELKDSAALARLCGQLSLELTPD